MEIITLKALVPSRSSQVEYTELAATVHCQPIIFIIENE